LCLNLVFTLLLAALGQKYVKFESKLHKNPLIYSEIPKKFPQWADFSKSALQIILKMVFFYVGEVPNRFQQEVERRYFKTKSRSKKAPDPILELKLLLANYKYKFDFKKVFQLCNLFLAKKIRIEFETTRQILGKPFLQ
jgi:hypothetical protein